MRPVLILIFAAALVACASGPKAISPGEQLSGIEARRCKDMAGMTSDLAALRARNVSKRQAIKLQLKAREVTTLEYSKRRTVTSEIYETAILVYAIPDFSLATLERFKWSECKTMALHNNALNYGDIVGIKDEVMRCQTQFEQKSARKHKACIDAVVKDRAQLVNFDQQTEQQSCRNLITVSINLHKKAVKLARKGSKQTALGSLEKSMTNWKKIANGTLRCSNIEKAIAADGILRANQDMSSIARI